MRRLTLAGLVAAALAAGCAGRYQGTVYASTPNLVAIDDGVYVVADYNEPVFYADNYYWRYYGNTWYRSPYWDRGWVYASPPHVIARIDQPMRYRHYRGGHVTNRGGYIRDHRTVRTAPRTYRDRPVYRDRDRRDYRRY